MNGQELRELRKSAGIQAYRLAEALEITPATLSNYERGKASIPKKIELATRYLCEPNLPPKSATERLAEAIREIVHD